MYEVIEVPPIRFCAICGQRELACTGAGPHIYDGLAHRWVLRAQGEVRPISHHLTEDEANAARRAAER